MDSILKEIFVLLGMKTDDEGFEHAYQKIEKLKAVAEILVETAKEVGHEILEMFEGVAHEATELEHLSKRTGISTGFLQALGNAAVATGSDLSSVTMAARGLSMQMLAASEGNQEAAETFAKLGVKVTDIHGKLRPLEDVLGQVQEKFEKLPDGPEKLALASKLFSRSGGQMILVLEKLKQAQAEAEAAGANLSEQQQEDGIALHESMLGLELSFKGLRNAIVGPLLKPLALLVQEFSGWVRANRQLIASGVAAAIRAIGTALYIVWRFAQPVIALFAWLAKHGILLKAILVGLGIAISGYLGASILAIIPVIGGLIASLGALTLAEVAAAAVPVLIGAAFLALLATLALVAEDIYTYFKPGGGRSITGVFVNGLKKLVDFVGPIMSAMFVQPIKQWKSDLEQFAQWLFGWFAKLPAPIQKALGVGAAVGATVALGPAGLPLVAQGASMLLGGGAAKGPGAMPPGIGANGLPVVAPSFKADIQVQTQPGMDNVAVGHAVSSALDDWHSKMVERALISVGGQYSPVGAF